MLADTELSSEVLLQVVKMFRCGIQHSIPRTHFHLLLDVQGGPAKVKPTYIFAGNVWYLNV